MPTSEGREEDKGEGKPQTVIVDNGGGIVVHQRQSDGTLDEGREFSDAELVPDGAIPDEDARRIKTVDIDTLVAIKDIIEADKAPEPRASATSREFTLHFSKSERNNFVAGRKIEDNIDPRIRELVSALNEIPGLDTNSSCEGHDTAELGQTKKWYIDFSVQPNKRGWAALHVLAYAVCKYHARSESDVRIDI